MPYTIDPRLIRAAGRLTPFGPLVDLAVAAEEQRRRSRQNQLLPTAHLTNAGQARQERPPAGRQQPPQGRGGAPRPAPAPSRPRPQPAGRTPPSAQRPTNNPWANEGEAMERALRPKYSPVPPEFGLAQQPAELPRIAPGTPSARQGGRAPQPAGRNPRGDAQVRLDTPYTEGSLLNLLAYDKDALSAAEIQRIMPHATPENVDLYLRNLNIAMGVHGIETPAQRAAFLGQIAVESGQLSKVRENLYYPKPGSLRRTYGERRFPSAASEEGYLRNPERLGNYVYAQRNGNRDTASGDGYRFAGGGLMQVTGRANYGLAGYEADPEATLTPWGAADSAARWWAAKKMPQRTVRRLTREEFERITGTVNARKLDNDLRWAAYLRGLDALEGH